MTVIPAARGKKIFCFGYGYTAQFLAEILRQHDWQVAGTTTDPEKLHTLQDSGIDAYFFDCDRPLKPSAFDGVTHILFSIPPDGEGDPAFLQHAADIPSLPSLEWAGYLSTTGIYGNHDGGWVDEKTRPLPASRRGALRLMAEEQWQSLSIPLHIFRLAGIYGPGRSAIETILSGAAQRIDKPGHVFNRIHVEDIVQTLVASMNNPAPGAIYNLADDMPAGSSEVIEFACEICGIDPPPLKPFDPQELSPMARGFYADNKRVKNDRIKQELGVNLLFPDYRAGLSHCLDVMKETESLLV